ncbi:MAG: hypothetical protein SF069_10860 [Phycisphaerae bacterium]|nr:hypothetical protein [Phycisphaerae bacterium]
MSMRLRVALEGRSYDVEVELLPPPAAASGESRSNAAAFKAPWHGLSTGKPGETTAPMYGLVSEVYVKVGDAIRANDPVVLLDVSAAYSSAAGSVLGTVRAASAGVVKELLVEKNQLLDIGQVIIRCAA